MNNSTTLQSAAANANKPLMIAITGGIGSGKSLVCRILLSLGYKVYDCDSRAKKLMDESHSIKKTLVSDITSDAVNSDGTINRRALASVVFSNPAKLAILDKAVHSVVTTDITQWRDSSAEGNPSAGILFVETAIPFKSGLYRMVDDIWEVTAPEMVRVARAISRDNTTMEAIKNRIASQTAESPSHYAAANPEEAITYRTLPNDGTAPLLPAIQSLLAQYGVIQRSQGAGCVLE